VFTASECRIITKPPPPRPRSVSPKKRSREAGTKETMEEKRNSGKRKTPKDQQIEQELGTPEQDCKRRRCCSSNRSEGGQDGTSKDLSRGMHSHFAAETPSTECVENDSKSLQQLVLACLQTERNLSDPNKSWQREQSWARTAMDRPLCSDEVRRVYKAMGVEIFDE